jgi:hypothetical protein
VDVAEVRRRVDEIRASADDDEGAHSMEDALHADVLAAIAVGDLRDVEAIQCAAIALTTDTIEFARWCA